MNDSALAGERVEIYSRGDLANCLRWREAFAAERKDHRYYELVEDTLHPEFAYRYFVIKDGRGNVRAVQPFFILDQDLLAGTSPAIRGAAKQIRRLLPRWLHMRTLMVGCVAGEAHLDGGDETQWPLHARLLAAAIVDYARSSAVRLIVLKEFPQKYRSALESFLQAGFTRIPSMPMTRLGLEYASFEDYTMRALRSARRKDLRKKFRAAEKGAPIEMSIVGDATPIIDEIYPLYLRVYERSKLRFEKLSKAFLAGLGQRMPEKVRFFVWRQNGRIVSFAVCMLQGDAIYGEYMGLDYSVALDLHLYHYVLRDIVTWAMARGYKRFLGSGLNYDTKLHFRHVLEPLDLYVRHSSSLLNVLLKPILPFIEPTRFDKTLRKFPNHRDLWA